LAPAAACACSLLLLDDGAGEGDGEGATDDAAVAGLLLCGKERGGEQCFECIFFSK
jgi:hypothetical protein